jgi:hypothetical protein
MANLYTPPIGARVISAFAPGDFIDIVNWPSPAITIQPTVIPANTLLVVPFFSGYVLNYDLIRFSYNGSADVTWGLYSYQPSDRSGALLNATGGFTINGTTNADIPFPPGTIYPGRTYAVAVNSSANWSMDVYSGNGAGSTRILGFDWVGNSHRLWTHLRTPLAYNATLPSTLPAPLTKDNTAWPPNPFFRSV